MRTQKPYLIAYKDAERACREFDEHRYEDFEPLRTDGAAHQCSDLGRKLTPYQRYLLELGFTMDIRESDASKRQQTPKNRRQGAIRAGEERRKIKIPPPPGSPVRSGLDRRTGDRRTGSLQAR